MGRNGKSCRSGYCRTVAYDSMKWRTHMQTVSERSDVIVDPLPQAFTSSLRTLAAYAYLTMKYRCIAPIVLHDTMYTYTLHLFFPPPPSKTPFNADYFTGYLASLPDAEMPQSAEETNPYIHQTTSHLTRNSRFSRAPSRLAQPASRHQRQRKFRTSARDSLQGS
jgi:hypothetical protein